MKFIFTNFLVLVFALNSALAFTPSVEDQEITDTLNSIEKELEKSETAMFGTSKKMSSKKFERVKRKNIRKLSKRINHLSKLTPESQEEYILNRLQKNFSKLRKITNKVLKRDRMMRKLAVKSNISVEELKAQLLAKVSSEKEDEVLFAVKQNAESYGGYVKYVEHLKNKMENFTYQEYEKSFSDNSALTAKVEKKLDRKIASLEDLIIILIISFSAAIGTIVFLILGAIVLATGGAAGPLFICAGVSAIFAFPYFLIRLSM